MNDKFPYTAWCLSKSFSVVPVNMVGRWSYGQIADDKTYWQKEDIHQTQAGAIAWARKRLDERHAKHARSAERLAKLEAKVAKMEKAGKP